MSEFWCPHGYYSAKFQYTSSESTFKRLFVRDTLKRAEVEQFVVHKFIDWCILHLSYAQPTLRSILQGETESFFKVRHRGRDWDIWPLQQEDMVKILLSEWTSLSMYTILQYEEVIHFLRGIMGDVIEQVVIGTPSLIDHVLFPEVCVH